MGGLLVESHACEPTLRFEILGPLRAWQGDLELDLGPAKQRAVLAVLLTHANKPVQTARIVEEVWGDDRPENGANVVQKYVAGLRRVLEPDRPARSPGQLLTLTNAGYLLNVESDSVDVDRFQALVQQARVARAEDRLVEASRLMGEAIGLWRAEALANLSEPLLDTARRRLNEMRVAALEEWAEVELDLGHHSRQVPELARLVTEFPLREQLRYLLMLALYRCGRQAEAYSAYRDARGFLVEEFGVEPSKRLQLLHERMLQTDPALEWRPAGAPAEATSQHPPAPSDLPTGRPPALPPAMVTAVDAARAPEPLPARRASVGAWFGRAVAVGIPIISFGLLTWPVIAYLAGRRRSVTLGWAAVGYFALLAIVMLTLTNNEESDAMQPGEIVGLVALFVAMLGGAVHAALIPFETPATDAPPRSAGQRVRRWLLRWLAIFAAFLSLGFLTWVVITVFAALRCSWKLGLAAAGYLAIDALIPFMYSWNPTALVIVTDYIWLLAWCLSLFGGTVHVALLTSEAYRATPPTSGDIAAPWHVQATRLEDGARPGVPTPMK